MAKISEEQPSKQNMESSLVVSTFRSQPVWERGLLVLNSKGVTYIPLARTKAPRMAQILMVVWIVFTAIVAMRGGFVGILWTLLVFLPIIAILLIFSSNTRKQTMRKEKSVKASGAKSAEEILKSIIALDGTWEVTWEKVIDASLQTQRPFALTLSTTVYEGKRRFQLLGKASALDFADASETANALREAFDRYVPGKLRI